LDRHGRGSGVAFDRRRRIGKKKGGIYLLDLAERHAAEDLCEQLEKYGLFVVRSGELEAWLPELDIPRGLHGPPWLKEAFKRLGSDESSSSYVRAPISTNNAESGPLAWPAKTHEIWSFVRRIAGWIGDPDRRGIPS
jgi:hypothetical protein